MPKEMTLVQSINILYDVLKLFEAGLEYLRTFGLYNDFLVYCSLDKSILTQIRENRFTFGRNLGLKNLLILSKKLISFMIQLEIIEGFKKNKTKTQKYFIKNLSDENLYPPLN